MRHFVAAAGCVLGSVLWAGCAAGGDLDALDDEKTGTSIAALDVAVGELEGPSPTTPEDAAKALAGAKSKGCRTKTVDPNAPNVVQIDLAGCTGKFGRHTMEGRLKVTFTANADGSLHSETVSEGLLIDGRAFTRTVSSDIRSTLNGKTVTRHSEKTGTKPNGESLVQFDDETVVTDKATRCRTVNGTGRATVGGDRLVESKKVDVQTCETADGQDLCPTGRMEHASKGKSVVIAFDGSTSAKVSIVKRKGSDEDTWSLDCVPR